MAHAVDVRPCVSLREYRGLDIKATRTVIEKRWEATGRGRVLKDQRTDYSYPVQYRACGYSMAEVALIVVYHSDNNWGIIALRFNPEPGSTLHGHP